MTKSSRKSFQREIRGSMGRFLSILFIALLGVAIFSGLRATSPDMQLTADATYDSANFMDIQVLGTLGLTDDDLAAILHMDGVKNAEASYQNDVLCIKDNRELVVKAISIPSDINLIKLADGGRLPTSFDECLVDEEFVLKTGYNVGDTIDLKSGTDDDLDESISTDKVKIVGVCSTAMYLSSLRGTSSIGDGNVTSFMFLPKETFTMDYYAAIYVNVEGALGLNSFSEEYDQKVAMVIDNIKTLESDRCKVRFVEVKDSSNIRLEEANADYEKGKVEAQAKLDDAYQQLKDGAKKIADGRDELADRQEQVEEATADLQKNEDSLTQAKIYIEAGKIELENGKKDYNKNADTLASIRQSIKDQKAALAGIKDPNELAGAKAAIAVSQSVADQMEKELVSAKKQIEDGEAQIATYEPQIAKAEVAIEDGYKKLEDAQIQIDAANVELEEAELELENGKQEYTLAREDAEEELADAERKLDNAKDKIDNLEVPTWYVLDRSSVESSLSFEQDTIGIKSISQVFPAFFFIIAALVALTTMTRMVEEERIQIGTLKALGYSKISIASKYIAYAFIASLIGSVGGFLIGEKLIPYVVLRAYGKAYYNLGKAVIPINIQYAVTATLLAVSVICLSTLVACYKELISVPAQLMRPEAPKNGKRIFLERFKFLWKRLNFTGKATLRNLLRYKKRFYMTVFGVGGCMALLLVAFGIGDSVDAIGQKQFNEIFKYQVTVGFENDIDRAGRRSVVEDVKLMGDVKDEIQTYKVMKYFEFNEENIPAYFVVPENIASINNFIQLQKRTTGETLTLSSDGVIISEKLATLLNIKVGDQMLIKDSENSADKKSVTVAAITENYFYHYVYMSPELYQSTFNVSVPYNSMLLKTQTLDETMLSDQLLAVDGINSISLISTDQSSVDNVIGGLDTIVIVLIFAAALLAFIVLYNLNNININERRRELATLKLLGFYNNELAEYVFRENIIITALGIIAGAFGGIFLHKFVMQTAENDLIMLGREIHWLSYVFSTVLTAVFATIVNGLMLIKLKKIDMIESLKSVE